MLTPKQLEKTERTAEGHLLWKGGLSNGYPAVKQGQKTVYVRRMLWEETNGPIPEGMVVASNCGERTCIEPTHLILAKQGRGGGQKDANGKYTYESTPQTASIPGDPGPLTPKELAEELGVDRKKVTRFLRTHYADHAKNEGWQIDRTMAEAVRAHLAASRNT